MFPSMCVFYFDSPVFDGLFDFCSMYTGASMESATKLNHEVTKIILRKYIVKP